MHLRVASTFTNRLQVPVLNVPFRYFHSCLNSSLCVGVQISIACLPNFIIFITVHSGDEISTYEIYYASEKECLSRTLAGERKKHGKSDLNCIF